MASRFRTGDYIDSTGSYAISHTAHNLPRTVILLRGEVFPRCGLCTEPVEFELLVSDPRLAAHQPLRIYELQEIDPQADPASSGE
jgi:hypothetical protein